ncbi:MAG TPA: hypothetical protein PLZ93_14510 [Nocardioides sp.]|nr:hypothetical protein [Nocardioides sp.]
MTNVAAANTSSGATDALLPRPNGRSRSRGARNRRLREALLAYAFLLPAFLVVGLFGLFPLIFAAYQSTLRGINRVVGTFDGARYRPQDPAPAGLVAAADRATYDLVQGLVPELP